MPVCTVANPTEVVSNTVGKHLHLLADVIVGHCWKRASYKHNSTVNN